MSSFTNPNNQPLPSPTNLFGTQETVTQTWLTYWQTYLSNFFSNINRLTGGLGLDSDNIADKAITGKHISNNFYRATNPSSDVNFGVTEVVIFSRTVNIPFANADVKIKSQVSVETGLAGDNLFTLSVNRSQDNITFTNIWSDPDTAYTVANNFNTRHKKLSLDAIDTVPNAGIWYYQTTVRHDRNNQTIPTGLSASTVSLANSTRSKMTLEYTNQRQA